eukprot:SAG11_NODE_487_length_8999_cov_16.256966_2_plen_176_part_00
MLLLGADATNRVFLCQPRYFAIPKFLVGLKDDLRVDNQRVVLLPSLKHWAMHLKSTDPPALDRDKFPDEAIAAATDEQTVLNMIFEAKMTKTDDDGQASTEEFLRPDGDRVPNLFEYMLAKSLFTDEEFVREVRRPGMVQRFIFDQPVLTMISFTSSFLWLPGSCTTSIIRLLIK